MFQGKEAWYLYAAPCDSLALSDSNLVFHWLSEDPEIALNMSSMLTAWKLGAQQQTAGAVSSAQTPLVLLNNKYIFWVLSPLPEEEFSLDITNKEHPTLLCVGNAPTIRRPFPCYFLHRQRLDVTDEQSRQSDQHIHGR